MGKERSSLIMVGVLAALGAIVMGFVILCEMVITNTCGMRPNAAHPFAAFQLLVTGSTAGYEPIGSCEFPVGFIRWTALIILVVVIGGAIAGAISYARWKQTDAAFISQLRSREGFATARDVTNDLAAQAVL
mgnify:FL=1